MSEFLEVNVLCRFLNKQKWDPKARKVYLVGFELINKNFRIYNPDTKKINISCDIRFNEKQNFHLPNEVESKTYVIEDQIECDSGEKV